MTPKRIQRRRTRGWRMREGAVYVGRPTQWGNPFDGSSQGLANFRAYAIECGNLWLNPLRGRDLVCWCPLDQPCHAEVLLELANR